MCLVQPFHTVDTTRLPISLA